MKIIKSFLIILFTVLFVSALLCAIAEFYVRYKKLAPEVYSVQKGRYRLSRNPRIGYELVPNFYAEKPTKMVDFKGQGNQQGFRDYDHPIQKPKNAYRIIILGDSITQGYKIKNVHELFTSIVEKELKQMDADVEVFNFGVSGYNTQQEVETLKEKGLMYSPDLVVLSYCLNDTSKSSGRIMKYLLEEKANLQNDRKILLSSRINTFFIKSALYRLFYYRLIDPLEETSDDYKSLGKNTVEQYFAILATLAQTHNFEVVVAIFPNFENLDDYADMDKHDFIKKLAKTNNFHCLDLLGSFQECNEERRVFINRTHPNKFGHKCAGQSIAYYIKNSLLKESK